MRKIVVFTIAVLFIHLSMAAVKIKGNFTNSAETAKVYLYEYFINQFSPLDSTSIKDGKFQFKYKELPQGKYRVGTNRVNAGDVILSNESIILTADAKNIVLSLKIEESDENTLYSEYLKAQNTFKIGSDKINLKARKIAGNDPKRNEKVTQLQEEFNTLKSDRDNVLNAIITKSPSSFAAKNASYILSIDQLTKDNFFEICNNTTITRDDAISGSYATYLNTFLANKPEATVKSELRNLPKSKPEKSIEREVMYLSLINWVKTLDPNFASKIAQDYYKDYPNSKYKIYLDKELPKAPPGIGDYAPDLVYKNPEGKEMSLSSTKGNLVLLDFWASWCGPCRRENPNVVKTYEKYKDKGFTIFSVSLDKQSSRWIGAIEKDQLSWDTHVSDLKGWGSAAARTYGVNSIPSTFLIDQNGIIIAKNLRGHQLEKKIQEILEK